MISKHLRIFFLSTVALFLFLSLSCTNYNFSFGSKVKDANIIDGNIDISENGKVRLKRFDRYRLSGNWAFFSGKLYGPTDLKELSPDGKVNIPVPSDWSNIVGDSHKSAEGYGTYYLKFKISEKESYEEFALCLKSVDMPLKVFLNGVNIANYGKISTGNSSQRLLVRDKIIRLEPLKIDNELLIQVSNFTYRDRGGLLSAPEIVTVDWLYNHFEFCSVVNTFFFTAFAIIALIFMILYVIRLREKFQFYFSVVALFYAFYILFSVKSGLITLLPQIDFYLLLKIQRVLQVFAFGLFVIYNQSLYKQLFSDWVKYGVLSLMVIMTVLVIVVPLHYVDQFFFISYIILAFFILVNLIVFLIHLKSRQKGIISTTFFLLPVLAVTIYSLLNVFGIGLHLEYLMHGVMLLYFIVQIFLIQSFMNDIYIGKERLKKENLDLKRRTFADSLTGLPNKKGFRAISQYYWNYCINEDKYLTMGFVDIDFFALFNQQYGNSMGDACIKKVAHIVNDTLRRPEDFVSRDEGQRFLFMLPDSNVSDAKAASERIRFAVEKAAIEHKGVGDHARVTVSVGACSFKPSDAISTDKITKGAIQALHKAKNGGRNECRVFLVKKD